MKIAQRIMTGALVLATMVLAPAIQRSIAQDEPVIVENAADIWDAEGAPWPRWDAHDAQSAVAPDYGAWTQFMKDYAEPAKDGDALDFVRVANKGMGYLGNFIHTLEQVPVSRLNRNEQLAFWLNLHNAAAVHRTATSLPLEDDSVRVLVMGERWREQTLLVDGENLSLVDIARRIVMRQWNDPRVLYGLYLPAYGAPGLPREPFRGVAVWAQLDARARAFVNSPRAVEIRGDELHVSALYFWDRWLLPNEPAVLAHLKAFASPSLRQELDRFETVTATFLNWRVNSYNSGYDPNQDRRAGS